MAAEVKQVTTVFSLSLIIMIIIVYAVLSIPVYAACIEDRDWPEKPCLDTPPYSESYLREVWAPYYDYKGDEWMEMKKAEMEQAAEEERLSEWRQDQSEPNNFANENVYRYYQVFDQAPDTIKDSGLRDDIVVTYWYNSWYDSPIAWAAIASIIVASTIGVFTIKRARKGH